MTKTQTYNHYEQRIIAATRSYTFNYDNSKVEAIKKAWKNMHEFMSEHGTCYRAEFDRLHYWALNEGTYFSKKEVC